jgi:hypothetical protein
MASGTGSSAKHASETQPPESASMASRAVDRRETIGMGAFITQEKRARRGILPRFGEVSAKLAESFVTAAQKIITLALSRIAQGRKCS